MKKLLISCVVIAALGLGIQFIAKPILRKKAIEEVATENVLKLRAVTSAAPLLCSLALSEKEEAAGELLERVFDYAQDKFEECGGSIVKMTPCVRKYDQKLEDAVISKVDEIADNNKGVIDSVIDGVSDLIGKTKDTIKQGKAIYGAYKLAQKSLNRALARAKMIETYDQKDVAAKGALVDLLQYISDLGIEDIFNTQNVKAEIKEKSEKLKSAATAWKDDVQSKLPATQMYLGLEGLTNKNAMAEFFAEPQILAVIASVPVLNEKINKPCDLNATDIAEIIVDLINDKGD